MLDFFEDEDGGFYLTAHDAEELIDRPKETYDGAIPSGNSVAAMVLETFAQLTGEVKWRRSADRQMRFAAGQAALSGGLLLCPAGDDLNILFKSLANTDHLVRCAPFTEAYPVPSQGVSGYLCENGACRKSNGALEDLLNTMFMS